MAGKISELTELTTVNTGDYLEILDETVSPAVNKKITQANLLATALSLTGNQSVTGTKTFESLNILNGTTSANGINFGSDINLYRAAAGTLRTDTAFVAGDRIDVNTYIQFFQTTGQLRLSGSSNGSYDVNLYASAANTLKTDDNLIVAGSVGSSAGNVVTVDGTQTLTNKTLTSPVIQGLMTGWVAATDTWVYASATSFTISSVDRTAYFTPGTRLKLTQTTDKYFVVVSSSFSTNTTVNVTAGTTYSLANAAITSPFYSYQVNPVGYPGTFAYTPVWTLNSGTLTTTYTLQTGSFSVVGKVCTFRFEFTLNVVSVATASKGFQVSIPITNAAPNDQEGIGTSVYLDSGIDFNAIILTGNAASYCEGYKGDAGATDIFGVDPAKTLQTADRWRGSGSYLIAT